MEQRHRLHSAAISARPANFAFGLVMGFLPVEVAPECTASRIEYQSHSRGRAQHADTGEEGWPRTVAPCGGLHQARVMGLAGATALAWFLSLVRAPRLW